MPDEDVAQRAPTAHSRLGTDGACCGLLDTGHRSQLDPMLPGKRPSESNARDAVAGDEDLPQEPSRASLLLERVLEVAGREQAFLDEQRPERAPGEMGLIHPLVIGPTGMELKRRAKGHAGQTR